MNKNRNCNYKLLDCGEFEKLEQIDDVIIRRSAPQAIWERKLNKETWDQYQAKYDLQKHAWEFQQDLILPHFLCDDLIFELRFSTNGQIGIFPEQEPNWRWLQDVISKADRPLNILNGFAYTGASTLFASSAEKNTNSINVTHVDAAAGSVKWARENCRLSNLENNNIRWIVDDIIKFLTREFKRGNKYDGIILDPPAFGRGKKSATWKLDRDLPKLMQLVDQVLSSTPEFIILSCHDKAFGNNELQDNLSKIKKFNNGKIETVDLTIKSLDGNDLPSGNCARWRK